MYFYGLDLAALWSQLTHSPRPSNSSLYEPSLDYHPPEQSWLRLPSKFNTSHGTFEDLRGTFPSFAGLSPQTFVSSVYATDVFPSQMPVWSPQQWRVLQLSSRAMAAGGILASLSVLLTFLLWKRFRTPANRLIFFMFLADFISSLAMFLGRWIMPGHSACAIQAFLLHFGDLSSVAWTAAMSFNLFLVLFLTKSARDLESLERHYFFLCFGLAFALAFVPLFVFSPEKGTAYGNAGLWCSITPSWPGLQFGLYFLPIWTIFSLNAIVYSASGVKIVRKTRRYKERAARAETYSSPPIAAADRRSSRFLRHSAPEAQSASAGMSSGLKSAGRTLDTILEIESVDSEPTLVMESIQTAGQSTLDEEREEEEEEKEEKRISTVRLNVPSTTFSDLKKKQSVRSSSSGSSTSSTTSSSSTPASIPSPPKEIVRPPVATEPPLLVLDPSHESDGATSSLSARPHSQSHPTLSAPLTQLASTSASPRPHSKSSDGALLQVNTSRLSSTSSRISLSTPTPSSSSFSSSITPAWLNPDRCRPRTSASVHSFSSTASQVSNVTTRTLTSFRRRYFFRVSLFVLAFLLVWTLPSASLMCWWQSPTACYNVMWSFDWMLTETVLRSGRGLIHFCCFFLMCLRSSLKERRKEKEAVQYCMPPTQKRRRSSLRLF